MSYSISFTVAAASRFGAIDKAVALLRTGIVLRGVNHATQGTRGMWTVSLNVWEDV